AVAGGRCRGGGGQHQRGRGGGVHRQVGGRGEVIGGIGGGQRLRPGLDQRGRKGALTVGQRRVGRQVHRGAGIAAAEVDGAGIARVGVAKGILRRHREGKARAGRRRRRGCAQRQLAGRRGTHRLVHAGGEAVGRVGGRERLRPSPGERHGEGPLAVGQRRIRWQHHARRGVRAAEMHSAVVGGDRVARTVFGGDRNG